MDGLISETKRAMKDLLLSKQPDIQCRSGLKNAQKTRRKKRHLAPGLLVSEYS